MAVYEFELSIWYNINSTSHVYLALLYPQHIISVWNMKDTQIFIQGKISNKTFNEIEKDEW